MLETHENLEIRKLFTFYLPFSTFFLLASSFVLNPEPINPEPFLFLFGSRAKPALIFGLQSKQGKLPYRAEMSRGQ
jgi:hypothetical protein